MTKRMLITGGAGYIGSHTVLAALAAGYDLAVVDTLSTGVQSSILNNVQFYEDDVANKTKMINILKDFQPEAVIHFAGSIVVPESVQRPIKYYQNNTLASLNLIDACLKTGTRNFIFSSTAAVYGNPKTTQVTERSIVAPINPYGHSKLMTEQILADTAAAYDLNYTVLRYFNVAGADKQLRTGQSTPNATHLIKVACQSALGMHPTMQVFGTTYDTADGTCVRDFIHVSDLAQAHLDALHYMLENKCSSTFNCGNGRGYSVKEILESVQRVSGVKLNIEYTDRRLGDPPSLIADSRALQAATGWVAQYQDIDEIVKTAFEWEQKSLANIAF
jgi:UDP-glucose 4-epimerase